jgi:hypothetical protein
LKSAKVVRGDTATNKPNRANTRASQSLIDGPKFFVSISRASDQCSREINSPSTRSRGIEMVLSVENNEGTPILAGGVCRQDGN